MLNSVELVVLITVELVVLNSVEFAGLIPVEVVVLDTVKFAGVILVEHVALSAVLEKGFDSASTGKKDHEKRVNATGCRKA